MLDTKLMRKPTITVPRRLDLANKVLNLYSSIKNVVPVDTNTGKFLLDKPLKSNTPLWIGVSPNGFVQNGMHGISLYPRDYKDLMKLYHVKNPFELIDKPIISVYEDNYDRGGGKHLCGFLPAPYTKKL